MDAVTALAGGALRPLAMSGLQQDEKPVSCADAEFDALYHPQARRVLQTCRYLLGSPEEAEDAAQEVFLRARQRFEQYDRERPFASWILGVASHHCIDRLRRRGREVIGGGQSVALFLGRTFLGPHGAGGTVPALLVGLLAVFVAVNLPFLGWIVNLALTLIGLGGLFAWLLAAWRGGGVEPVPVR